MSGLAKHETSRQSTIYGPENNAFQPSTPQFLQRTARQYHTQQRTENHRRGPTRKNHKQNPNKWKV